MSDNILLLTACIHPKNVIDKTTNLNRVEREKQYEGALDYYINKSDFDKIIFCDNSNYKLKYFQNLEKRIDRTKIGLIEINGKTLEYITYDGNKFAGTLGYGYGEQETLDYAVDNSIILGNLSKSDSFFKISGRYILYNINNIINIVSSQENMLLKSPVHCANVLTAFFKIQKKLYIDNIYSKAKEIYKKYDRKLVLEDVRYLCLKDVIYKNINNKRIYNLYYLYDGTLLTWGIKNKFLYKIIYVILCFFKLNQHISLFKIMNYFYLNKNNI